MSSERRIPFQECLPDHDLYSEAFSRVMQSFSVCPEPRATDFWNCCDFSCHVKAVLDPLCVGVCHSQFTAKHNRKGSSRYAVSKWNVRGEPRIFGVFNHQSANSNERGVLSSAVTAGYEVCGVGSLDVGLVPSQPTSGW